MIDDYLQNGQCPLGSVPRLVSVYDPVPAKRRPSATPESCTDEGLALVQGGTSVGAPSSPAHDRGCKNTTCERICDTRGYDVCMVLIFLVFYLYFFSDYFVVQQKIHQYATSNVLLKSFKQRAVFYLGKMHP